MYPQQFLTLLTISHIHCSSFKMFFLPLFKYGHLNIGIIFNQLIPGAQHSSFIITYSSSHTHHHILTILLPPFYPFHYFHSLHISLLSLSSLPFFSSLPSPLLSPLPFFFTFLLSLSSLPFSSPFLLSLLPSLLLPLLLSPSSLPFSHFPLSFVYDYKAYSMLIKSYN